MTTEKITVIEPHKGIEVLSINDAGVRHRASFAPGEDVSGQSPNVQAVAAEHWTPEVIASYRDAQNLARRGGLTEAEFRARQVSAECRRRIYGVASVEAQMNMAAATAVISGKTASVRTDEEKSILAGAEAAIGWVAAMRAAVATLAVDVDADFTADAAWPDVPPEALAMIQHF